MVKYVHKFQSEADFKRKYHGSGYLEPWLSLTDNAGNVTGNKHVNYNKSERDELYSTPFTVVALDDGDIYWTYRIEDASISPIQYSKNGGAWTTLAEGNAIEVVSGDEVAFKGNNAKYSWYDEDFSEFYPLSLSTELPINVKGNIMSLVYGDDFATADYSLSENVFAYFFCMRSYSMDPYPISVVSARDLILPATTLSNGCYSHMFFADTNLTMAPELPATTLAANCYYEMFADCTSLTAAPELPATQLASHCYAIMFSGCQNLTEAPKLPATTLAEFCYHAMFQACTGLTVAPKLPATTLARYCYYAMFYSCENLITAPELPATTLAEYCYQDMFGRCLRLEVAPELPATTLEVGCYWQMFVECSGLTQAPSLPATTLKANCYIDMFKWCTSLTTAPELPATTLVEGCYVNMFSGCTAINYIKAMFTTRPNNTYTGNWVVGVSSTGTFVKNASASWTDIGTYAIPNNWTIETASS